MAEMSFREKLSASGRPPRSAAERSERVDGNTVLRIVTNVATRVARDNLMLVAAGVAFYGMTAIFPAMAAFVSIYGLFADPNLVEARIAQYSGLLPPESLRLLTGALENFASKSQSTLSLALVVSLVTAVWSAKAALSALMTGLNIANETTEKRNFIFQQAVGLALTLGALAFAAVALAAVALLPAILRILPLTEGARSALGIGRWPLLALLVGFALAALYRFGPSRENAKWKWITIGSATATVLWLVGSGLFSFYVSHFGSYDKTYGSLAAPVVLLLWLWLSGLVILLGAEIDAEMEYADGKAARPVPDGAP